MTLKTIRDIFNHTEELYTKKHKDYVNSYSNIKPSDYYPRGVDTIYDFMNTKMLRIRSVLDGIKNNKNQNYESIQDSCFDLINYTAFLILYMNKSMEGQQYNRDIFNTIIKNNKV